MKRKPGILWVLALMLGAVLFGGCDRVISREEALAAAQGAFDEASAELGFVSDGEDTVTCELKEEDSFQYYVVRGDFTDEYGVDRSITVQVDANSGEVLEVGVSK